MASDQTTTMSAPPKREQPRAEPKANPYARFQEWASLHLPVFWRLRMDILVLAYVVLFVGAITVPITFAGMSGPRDQSEMCGNYRYWVETRKTPPPASFNYDYNQSEEINRAAERDFDAQRQEFKRISQELPVPCAGALTPSTYNSTTGNYENQGYFVWQHGFNESEQSLIAIIFVGISAIFALVWPFFVSRGTRLRDVIGKTNAPGFATCVLVLAPLVVLPILAGHVAFAASFGDLPMSLFVGRATVEHGQMLSEPNVIYFPPSTYSYGYSSFSLALLIFGSAIALLLALILKIVIYDGVVGLLRTAVIAAAIAAPAIIGAILLDSLLQRTASSMDYMVRYLVDAAAMTVPLAVLWIAYQKDLFKGVRRRMTRPLAFVFLLLWPFWFGWVSILALATYSNSHSGSFSSSSPQLWVYFFICFIVGVLLEAQLFRGIAKISLLPRP